MKPALTLIFFICLNYCLAQNNWKPGFIVAAGDTTYGYIDDRGTSSLSLACYFRSDPTADRQVFGPTELDGFGFSDNKMFVSRTPEGSQQAFFMEFLLLGRINFFHMMDTHSRFFAEKEGTLYELKNTVQDIQHPEKQHSTSIKYQAERKEYIGMLMYLMADGGLEGAINQSKLRVNSLVDLAYNYHMNVCPDEECIDFTRKKRKSRLEVGLTGGMYMHSFKYGKSIGSNQSTGNFMGLRLELHDGFDFLESVSLVLDLNFFKFTDYTLSPLDRVINFLYQDGQRYILSKRELYHDEQVPSMEAKLNTVALNVPLVFNWKFVGGGTFRPYAGAGLVNMFILSQNDEFVNSTFVARFGKSVPGYHLGYTARAGSKIKLGKSTSAFVEASLQQTMNPHSLIFRLTSKTVSFNAGLSF